MANANAPRGIIPYRKTSGQPYNNGIPGLTFASAGGSDYILGANMGRIIGGEPPIAVQRDFSVYVPANTAAYILVADDPDLLYWVQEDSVGGAMVQGAPNRNADLVAGTGNTTTGYSGWQLQSSTLQTTNTLQMRIVRGLEESDNVIGSAYAKWLVRINLNALTNQTGV